MKQELQKRLDDQKNVFDKQLAQNAEKHKRAFVRLKGEAEAKIKMLEIQLAEHVVEKQTLKKANQEQHDQLMNQLEEKTQRIHKLESDYEELQRKHAEMHNEKQELQHDFNSLNEQVQRIKSMMLPLGSSKKRRVTEML